MTIEEKILKTVISNETFCRIVIPHLEPKYFEGGQRLLYKVFLEYVSKYNRIPSTDILRIEFKNSSLALDPNRNEFFTELSRIEKSQSISPNDEEWLIASTEKWCREKAIHCAILDSISILDGKGPQNLSEGAIPDMLSKALGISFNKNVGHDYTGNAEMRWEEYHKKETKIPFDLECFNEITSGGLTRKTMSIILAGTGGGKSLCLCHLAGAALSAGHNVLYITLEMSEVQIAKRIDANLLDININDLESVDKKSFMSKMSGLKTKTNGRLVIKEYPTATANANHFRALLEELKLKKDFHPDVLIVDYLGICAAARIRDAGNSYTYNKAIAEELRGLAVEHNLVLLTANQTNRTGYGDSDVDITSTAESFGVPMSADLMFALIKNEKLDSEGKIMVKQLKNRYNDINVKLRFMVGFEGEHMRLYDLDDPSKGIMPAVNVNVPAQGTKVSPFNNKRRPVPDADGLIVE